MRTQSAYTHLRSSSTEYSSFGTALHHTVYVSLCITLSATHSADAARSTGCKLCAATHLRIGASLVYEYADDANGRTCVEGELQGCAGAVLVLRTHRQEKWSTA